MLPYCSFISVLLHCLLLCLSVSSGSVLLCSPHHVDLPLVTLNQCRGVTRHVGRIHYDTTTLPSEAVKHHVVEIDSLLKGCSVIMLDLQILISFPSADPDKDLIRP